MPNINSQRIESTFYDESPVHDGKGGRGKGEEGGERDHYHYQSPWDDKHQRSLISYRASFLGEMDHRWIKPLYKYVHCFEDDARAHSFLLTGLSLIM